MKLNKATIRPLFWATALFGLAAVSIAWQQGPADPQVEAARRIYKPEVWPKSDRHAGFDLARLTVPGYIGETVIGHDGLVTRRFLTAEDRKPSFQVELYVRDEAKAAHEDLLEWVASVSAKKLVPTGEQLDMAVGDISFVGPSQRPDNRPLWIAFTRGNLAVRLSAQDLRRPDAPDLVGITRRIDRGITSQKALPAGVAVPRPVIEAFACSTTECTAGDLVALELDVVDPAGGVARPSFVVGGPAQGYVEMDSEGVWQLHTTGPGAMTLIVEVMGSNGTFDTRRVMLEVGEG